MLENLGNIGEFIGALGVVVSLVYLARQMIQNTASVRAASFNSMVQNSIRLLEPAYVDAEFAAFLARAERDPARLSAEERVRWDAYMTAAFRHFNNVVYQFRVGAIDRQMWEAYRRALKEHLRVATWASWYLENQVVFSEALTHHVQTILAELKAESPTVVRPLRKAVEEA